MGNFGGREHPPGIFEARHLARAPTWAAGPEPGWAENLIPAKSRLHCGGALPDRPRATNPWSRAKKFVSSLLGRPRQRPRQRT